MMRRMIARLLYRIAAALDTPAEPIAPQTLEDLIARLG